MQNGYVYANTKTIDNRLGAIVKFFAVLLVSSSYNVDAIVVRPQFA
jgi:hypothetical protein